MSNDESLDHEIDVTTDHCIRYYDTGDGYLVFRVRMEYHADLERWFPVQHELLGVSEVEDWIAIEEVVEELTQTDIAVRNLPEYSLEDHIRAHERGDHFEDSGKDE